METNVGHPHSKRSSTRFTMTVGITESSEAADAWGAMMPAIEVAGSLRTDWSVFNSKIMPSEKGHNC